LTRSLRSSVAFKEVDELNNELEETEDNND
jgi:hypothetical protein